MLLKTIQTLKIHVTNEIITFYKKAKGEYDNYEKKM